MIKIDKKEDCCGCNACVQRCPKHCIAMVEDQEGFSYPRINSNLCVDCGLCEKVCPKLNIRQRLNTLGYFAVKNNNESERLLNQYMQQNGLSYITEEVLQKGLNNAEKANTFSEFFSEIFSVGKELIIIDPYLFKDDSDEYCDLLADLLNKAAAHSIIVITNQKNYKQSSYNKTSGKVNNTIEIKYSNDFHDRFWISDRKKGFSTGTSLNGIGNKISSINLLPENDVTEIIKLLCLQSLI